VIEEALDLLRIQGLEKSLDVISILDRIDRVGGGCQLDT
jgi:hypothetical protein